ncbi:hypothetical protein VNO78_28069 [Psophocarpus tetragonolobus]|uniref:Uncharacterized protein n=1 Tax=Psophocarpus tetragonolobus TaxID=3891 RepID=A0AAN9XBB3_PSOTE
MCTHLPTSFVSLRVVRSLFECIDWLKILAELLSNISITDQEFKIALSISTVDESRVSCCSWQAKLCMTRKQCLEKLKSLQNISARLHAVEHCRLEMLVIDEAAQLKECESNIPLQFPGLRHVVLIGDAKQLPALVKSEVSGKAGFGRSLFERLVLLGLERHLLNVQYRMHPSISIFPNMEFYDNQILDSQSVKERSHERHFLHGDMFKFYSFINVAYGQDELDEGNSRKNIVEVAVISEIVLDLCRGNSETLLNSGSVWERLVLDARARGCYHNADEDDRLFHAIITAMIELGQVGDLLNLDSLLFRKARWKVFCSQNFLISIERIKRTEICKRICSLLMQLSSGWRQPHQEINFGVVDDTSFPLLELYKVNELLYLAWTIDVHEENSNYVQVLKIWDVLPLSEVYDLARDVDISYSSYSADILKCCKTRCSDGYNFNTNYLICFTWLWFGELYFEFGKITRVLFVMYVFVDLSVSKALACIKSRPRELEMEKAKLEIEPTVYFRRFLTLVLAPPNAHVNVAIALLCHQNPAILSTLAFWNCVRNSCSR